MATSILWQRARVDRLALHATIAEPVTKRSMHTLAIEPSAQAGSCLKGGSKEEFQICYVEETPCPKDFTTTLEPQAIEPETPVGSALKGEPAEEFPICYVEEISWSDDYIPTRHAEKVMNDDEALNSACARINVDKAREGMNMEVGNETFSEAVTNDLHGPLLRVEHLALVFELRGHMADLEHRALLMGQHLDLLLDVYSNAPTKRKCPMCV
jgi:hypothetical protein